MVKEFRFILAAGLVSAMASLQSCSDKDSIDYSLVSPDAVVTVKPLDGNTSFYMQLDDETTLEPDNLSVSPFGDKEVRAFVNYDEAGPSEKYSMKVHINWIDSLLTKHLVADLGEENDTKYGNDPVEIPSSLLTLVEDGYLTIQFLAVWGNTGIAHEVNLINAGTEEDPYIVEFRHNAHGDIYGGWTQMAAGVVAFRLEDLENGLGLPDTGGETVKLTLRYKSFNGTETRTFDYCTRKDTSTGSLQKSSSYSIKLR